MFSPRKIALAISFTAILATLALAETADARTICRHDTRDCRSSNNSARSNDWYLHRPSTPKERAETAELNRGYQVTSNVPYQNGPYLGNDDYQRDQYERELTEFRAAQQRYEQEMRVYEGATDPRYRGYPPVRPAAREDGRYGFVGPNY